MTIAAIDEMTIMMVVVAIRKERKGRERERERGGEERRGAERSNMAIIIRRRCMASSFSFLFHNKANINTNQS